MAQSGRGTPGRPGALLVAAILVVAAGCGDSTPAPKPPPQRPSQQLPSQQAATLRSPAQGEELYRKNCLPCHGQDGIGEGPLSAFLLPRPRNFVAGKYRVTSTLQNEPTDEDLLATLRRGFPGTAMPSFGHLPEADLRALVAKVKAFAEVPLSPGVDPERPDRTGPIPIPAEPADDAAGREHGKALYLQGCAACHGPTGHGDGQQAQQDDRGMTTWPRNFASGEWKGGSDGASIYRRIVAGMAGSPMPAAPFKGKDAWDIVHWVRSESDLDPQGRNEQRRVALRAAKAPGEAPLDPADAAWGKAEEKWVAVMPLWMRRTQRIQGLRVAALTDGSKVALRLRWQDPTPDDTTFGQHDFRDAVAVQVSADADPPFFGMGGGETPGKGPPVALWMWKADRQKDADQGGGRDLAERFPDMAGDGYPGGFEKDRLVVRDLPLRDHDPLFLAGKAAGNGVSDLSGACPAESLGARGVGTLGFRKGGAAVEGRGGWKDGTWTVVLRRTLADEGDGAVALAAGGRASIAFALWNGSDGDRNGIKSTTVWHDLLIEEAAR